MPPKKTNRSSVNNNPITKLKLKKEKDISKPVENPVEHPDKLDKCRKCNKIFISKYNLLFPIYNNTCDSCMASSNKQSDSYGYYGNGDEDDDENDGKDTTESNHTNTKSNCCGNNDDFSNTFDNLFFASIISKLNKVNPIDGRNGKNNKHNKNKGARVTENLTLEDDNETDLEYEWLGLDIKDIDDLIRIGNTYNPKKRKRHNLNLRRLNMLVEPLKELKNMIGMTDVKKIIFDQIIYYLQKLDDKNVDMLHTVIVGPPGVGKTQLTHIIAKIYNKLGFLKTDNVICAKRDDLVGEYVGQTAPKTRKVLESALGGVLLLDEVYAMSPNSEKDFARESIDMINVYLSEHAHDLVCVVAGYKKPTYEKFLAYNEGLSRRFTHHFEIKGYTAGELALIYKKYLEEQKWQLGATVEEITPIIEKNLKYFPNFGGDMTTLFACCKKTHSKRLLSIPTEQELIETKKKIKLEDIEKGVKIFMEIKEKSKSSENDDIDNYMHMYS
jgi:AAA+ superfamily predicted ATPase